jgi:hypothetical protein
VQAVAAARGHNRAQVQPGQQSAQQHQRHLHTAKWKRGQRQQQMIEYVIELHVVCSHSHE